ncbi:DUF4126 domain-containing protein [Azohydromonas sediminis]|uniref:DUF4126 domain-containing protein n=1 Tax=Azohydromonas sediminis TaxID=2259674 RepID=UPI000E65E114|nr:DUF4126 domain-containing protein [Azohydromonas sediminis]
MNDVDVTQLVALAAALGWASGLRLYLVVFLTGLAGHLGWVELPGGLQLLQQPLLLWVSGALVVVEFLADKIPLVDSAWDAVQTVVRIPAGAALAGAVFAGQGIDGATWTVIAALVGGTLAATAHAAKAGTRAAVNTSPEPLSNLALSLAGDAFVPLLLWLAWEHPVAFFVALALAVVVAAVLIAVTFKFVGALWRRGRGRLSPVGA